MTRWSEEYQLPESMRAVTEIPLRGGWDPILAPALPARGSKTVAWDPHLSILIFS